ncbi:HTH-type transcriptional regulator CdhR [compost metagenome]
MVERRQFSGGMKGKNLRYLNDHEGQPVLRARAGFLLLEHFSLPAFTQALDTIVTANLLRPALFSTKTFGLTEGEVISDLGLVIRPDASLNHAAIQDLDLLVVCGGYRTALKADDALINLLREASDQSVTLAGVWNGAWFLGRAGLLDGYRCAIHPEHRPALAEIARLAQVTSEAYVVDRDRLTASSPNGTFYMALEWIKGLHDKALTDGIEDILAFEASRYRRIKPTLNVSVSGPLREMVNLMDANLEEPLEMEVLCLYAGRSRRQIERLFKEQLGTTPQRYYMDLRITEARRLLQHTTLTIVEVSVACGFVSPSHFSKCYNAYFGYRPSKEIRLVK